jgi:hypothetical protein
MINLNTETLLSFAELAARQPRSRLGRPCSVSTPWRWAMVGNKARDGSVVKLEYAKIGGRLITSVEALQRFSDRLLAEPNAVDAASHCDGCEDKGEPQVRGPRTATKRRRDSEKSSAALDKLLGAGRT